MTQEHLRPHTNLPKGHEDGFIPTQPLDVNKARSFSDMLARQAETGFQGRKVGLAVNTLVEMSKDKDTYVVMTVAGAMIPAGMGPLVSEMLDRGMVQSLVITGAQVAHGLVESVGMEHFHAPDDIDDVKLYKMGYNRILDTLEPESNLDDVERIFNAVLDKMDPDRINSSRLFTHEIGKHLAENFKGRGILKSAYKKGVPVFIPAFTDSELGLDVGLYNRKLDQEGKFPLRYDPFIDLDFYTELIKRQAGKKLGIFTIGGGVPRNWAQQVGPYIDLQAKRVAEIDGNTNPIEPVMFEYGIRICPEPVEWGGLSGCTYDEGKSWGKFKPDGKFTEVLVDATVVWPWIAKAAFQRIGRKHIQKDVFTGKKAIAEIEKEVESKYYQSSFLTS